MKMLRLSEQHFLIHHPGDVSHTKFIFTCAPGAFYSPRKLIRQDARETLALSLSLSPLSSTFSSHSFSPSIHLLYSLSLTFYLASISLSCYLPVSLNARETKTSRPHLLHTSRRVFLFSLSLSASPFSSVTCVHCDRCTHAHTYTYT